MAIPSSNTHFTENRPKFKSTLVVKQSLPHMVLTITNYSTSLATIK